MESCEQQKRKFRHETKHELRYVEYLSIRSRLRAVTGLDAHVGESGTYQIRSLYFDNYRDKALREKIDGVNEREKFRLRYYNGNADLIYLEKKCKVSGLCSKFSEKISKSLVTELLRGNVEPLGKSEKKLLIEFYVKIKNEQLSPRVIVDYLREPYVYAPGNVRITFDRNICTGLSPSQFLYWACPTVQTDKVETVLMEVKYDAYLPEIIQMCICENERKQEAFSKYATCRRFG